MHSLHSESSRGHIRALDGVRGVAFLLVFVFHGYGSIAATGLVSGVLLKAVNCGWIGVDLFFVLSGYLITGILMKSRTSPHYYRNFYARRALRIFPVYYLAIVAVFVIQPMAVRLLGVGDSMVSPWWIQIWYWLNLSNLISAFEPGAVYYLVHFWSLAIEEQFYLVWPAVVRRVSERSLLVILGCALAAGEIGRNLPVVVHLTERYHDFIYRLTPFHLDGLICGSMLAIVLGPHPRLKRAFRLPFAATATLVAVLAGLLSRFAGEAVWSIFFHRWGTLAAGVFFASCLGFLLSKGEDFWLARGLSHPVLRWLGTLSYCLYVIHIFGLKVGSIVAAHIPGLSTGIQNVVAPLLALIFCIGVAVVSRAYVERPALRLKRYFPADQS